VQAFENEEEELTNDLGSPQYWFILSVDLVSVLKPCERKKQGGFRVMASPAWAANVPMDQDDV
jgi:hypothetical protein